MVFFWIHSDAHAERLNFDTPCTLSDDIIVILLTIRMSCGIQITFFLRVLCKKKEIEKWNVPTAGWQTGKGPFFAWSVVQSWESNAPIVKSPCRPGPNFVTAAAIS
jgi:hypothetical protein